MSFRDLYHKNIITFLLVFFIPSLISAASFGTNTAEFLKIKPQPGPAAMGEAYAAISDDSTAMVFNPSGLALLDRIDVSATRLLWFDGINMTHAAFAMPLEQDMGLGVDILWIDFGEFDSTGIPGNEISVQNMTAGAGFGKSFGDILSAGISVKFLYESYVNESSLGLSADAGLMLKLVSRNLTLGLTARNIGAVFGAADSLPMEASAGLAYRVFSGKDTVFGVSVEASKILNTDNLFFGAGIEGRLLDALALRLGFRYNNALENSSMSFSDIQRMIMLSAGAGIKVGDFSVDYSFTPMADLGGIQRIGVSARFGESLYEKRLSEQKTAIEPKAIEAPNVKVEDGIIKLVSFKPNVPQENVKEWTLDIKTSDGKIIKTFSGVGEVPKNLNWDGTDSFGKISKADVDYIFDFKAKDTEGQVVKTVGRIVSTKKSGYIPDEGKRFVPVKGREMLVAPVTLLVSPDAEARRQVPFVMVNKKIKKVKAWSFDVYNAKNVPLKKFGGSGEMPAYLVWDGKDYDGNYVDDLKNCRYILSVEGVDGKKAEISDRQVIRDPFVIATKTKKIEMVRNVFFEANSYALMPEMTGRLNELGAEISKHKRAQIYVQGHSSAEGDRDYNITLSQLRGRAVLRYLVEKYGISPMSITTVGYGADVPADTGSGSEAAAKNRRVEIIMLGETE
ncbi:MAG TPA: PorV/PorQ family protein [Candidatus Goldiibacteriota bacterium]|nr:PorV/PorQ family protein [Candidatus Goldiibacteriota bacterium]